MIAMDKLWIYHCSSVAGELDIRASRDAMTGDGYIRLCYADGAHEIVKSRWFDGYPDAMGATFWFTNFSELLIEAADEYAGGWGAKDTKACSDKFVRQWLEIVKVSDFEDACWRSDKERLISMRGRNIVFLLNNGKEGTAREELRAMVVSDNYGGASVWLKLHTNSGDYEYVDSVADVDIRKSEAWICRKLVRTAVRDLVMRKLGISEPMTYLRSDTHAWMDNITSSMFQKDKWRVAK